MIVPHGTPTAHPKVVSDQVDLTIDAAPQT